MVCDVSANMSFISITNCISFLSHYISLNNSASTIEIKNTFFVVAEAARETWLGVYL